MMRKIRKGEVEAVKRDRRVYVRMHGPEHLSDDDLLSRAIDRVDDLEQTVLRVEQERDEARDAASASEEAHRKVETAYGEERATHRRTKWVARTLGLVTGPLFALLAVSILVAWRLFT